VNVRFCPSCRSLILVTFRFCPYCGAAAGRGPDLAEAADAAFGRMGALPERRGIFASAEESLDRLESDMDLLLEELEKEGRSPR
jgi:hypothetical protein